MKKSLLFIPDISGFTRFVQSTEIEHSQHVIAELLEILISSNILGLNLAEIEGDALFFYKEGELPSQEKLLAQVENTYTAFYGHMKMIEKNRICPCNACLSASKLQLKIVVHTGELQIMTVRDNRKPFGNAVIEAHRLLKNSIDSENYLLITKELSEEIGLNSGYESKLYSFKEGGDTYDNKQIRYNYTEIVPENLHLKPYPEPEYVDLKCKPNLTLHYTFQKPVEVVLEIITNYKYRHLWGRGVDRYEYNENEVTRLLTEHTCVINGQHLKFKTVTKKSLPNQLIYGEYTTSPPPVDELYQFFILEPITKSECKLTVEVFWKAKSPVKKLLIATLVKKQLKAGIKNSLDNLQELLKNESIPELP